MKNFKKHFILNSIIITVFLFASCSQNATFLQSTLVPAAHGKVKVKKDDNQNYTIDVEITDLAEVEKVYSRNHSYVVWMETDDGDTQKLGQLVSSRSLLSNQRKAQLETVSSSKPKRVLITAERNEDARSPNNNLILRTRNF